LKIKFARNIDSKTFLIESFKSNISTIIIATYLLVRVLRYADNIFLIEEKKAI